MTIIRRVGILSSGKVMGALYALVGLIFGGLVSLASVAGAFATRGGGRPSPAMFGVAAVVIFPILYGVAGFIGGIIVAALYNVIVSVVGGIELDLQET